MKKVTLVLLSLSLCFTLSSGNVIAPSKPQIEQLPISAENLWKEIKALDLRYPEFVFAQALLESGTFTSRLFRVHNNLFGMKVPKYRESVAIGQSKSGYAKYAHWTESVKDYALFQEYVVTKRGYDTKTEYIQYLDRLYSESTGYVRKLNGIITRYKFILQQS